MKTKEEVLEKVRNLLNLADKSKNNSDNEAEAAMLKAQQLMAKYDITLEEASEEAGPEYSSEVCEHKWDYGFRVPLASILADNFRCKTYLYGGKVTFMGHTMDARICRETFEFAYKYIVRAGNREYNRRYELGYQTKGVFNSYANGFIAGLKKSFDVQCVALAIVTPPDVVEKFEEMSKDWKTRVSRQGEGTDYETFRKGMEDGKNFMNKRAISE